MDKLFRPGVTMASIEEAYKKAQEATQFALSKGDARSAERVHVPLRRKSLHAKKRVSLHFFQNRQKTPIPKNIFTFI